MIPGLLLGLLTLIATFLFVSPPAWFPAAISGAAVDYDRQFQFTLWITGFIFIVCVLAFRRGIVGEIAARFKGVKSPS